MTWDRDADEERSMRLGITNYIDGEQVEAIGGAWLEKVDPATGEVYAEVPDSDERDVNRAVEAAVRAFPAWSRTPVAERSRLIMDLARRIDERLDSLARAETDDTGKPVHLSRSVDIPRASANLRFFATAILHFHSEAYRTDQAALNYTLRQPRGVVGAISPWNLPLYLFTWKIAPALATGNTVVAKPSELTPQTAFVLGMLAKEVGLPPGVLNIVHGLGHKVGSAIVAHPRVPTITFTGGTVTGAEVARTAAPLFKKVALELGGKNPNIVFADADLDEALAGSLRSAFDNQGEICLCGSRMFVERSIYANFVERFVAAARALKVGDPFDPDTRQGALISARHRDKVLSFIGLARELGGQVLCGGGIPTALPARCQKGFFVEPTVIAGLDVDCRVNQEEIFGPVVTVIPFDDEAEVVAFANATPFGLSASLWTRDLARAHRVAEQLDGGTVWVNCWLLRDLRVPFGGVKSSGVGREGGEEALRFFTDAKTVCVKFPASA
jgi:aminomuconate-semialdehyde/2-hydroxymuconate-6-semialdehyde dehydrogenase